MFLPGLGLSGREDTPEILDELEVDYTPTPVAVALLLACGVSRPSRMCDPAAGSGVWGRAARAIWGASTHLTGVEPRASETANLGRAYDAHYVGTFEQFAENWRGGFFDLVATNPPFSAFERRWWSACRRLLAPSGTVCFLGLSQWGQSEEAWPLLQEWSPSLQVRLGGRVAFRRVGETRRVPIPKDRRVAGGPTHEDRRNSTDSREYSLWVWRHAELGLHSWTTTQLPPFPSKYRRWETVPGTYEVDPGFVASVRALLEGGTSG